MLIHDQSNVAPRTARFTSDRLVSMDLLAAAGVHEHRAHSAEGDAQEGHAEDLNAKMLPGAVGPKCGEDRRG